MSLIRAIIALLAATLIGVSLWHLRVAEQGVSISSVTVAGVPATIYRPEGSGRLPAVVIAHGFAGSQQLMKSFALTFARNGYIALTFDFAGHGRNSSAMSGDIERIDGATRRLLDDMSAIAAEARRLGDGRIAVLGHSMASDIVVRFAQGDPSIAATIAVSMFSPAVTAISPRNLLMIVGDWEASLKREALRAAGLATQPQQARPGVTYGDFEAGTARRVAFVPHAEHVSVLFNQETMRQSLDWLDSSFGVTRSAAPLVDGRGVWILVLFVAVVLLAWPLSVLLPRVSPVPVGANLPWRRIWPGLLLPMIATPLVLRVLPTHFLPLLVGDYLAAHFFLYGFITLSWLASQGLLPNGPMSWRTFCAGLIGVLAFGFIGLVWPLDSFVTSFVPVGIRPLLIAVLLAGTLVYFLSDEWLTRGANAAPGAYVVTKLAFMCSLAIAVALDPAHLFFLVIIVPVMVPFLVVYGLFSTWIYAATGYPPLSAAAAAVAFAWAIGVTFPMVSG